MRATRVPILLCALVVAACGEDRTRGLDDAPDPVDPPDAGQADVGAEPELFDPEREAPQGRCAPFDREVPPFTITATGAARPPYYPRTESWGFVEYVRRGCGLYRVEVGFTYSFDALDGHLRAVLGGSAISAVCNDCSRELVVRSYTVSPMEEREWRPWRTPETTFRAAGAPLGARLIDDRGQWVPARCPLECRVPYELGPHRRRVRVVAPGEWFVLLDTIEAPLEHELEFPFLDWRGAWSVRMGETPPEPFDYREGDLVLGVVLPQLLDPRVREPDRGWPVGSSTFCDGAGFPLFFTCNQPAPLNEPGKLPFEPAAYREHRRPVETWPPGMVELLQRKARLESP